MNQLLLALDFGMEFYFLLIVLAVIIIVVLSILGRFIQSCGFRHLFQVHASRLFNIIGMSLSKIPPRVIVNARITLFKAGLKH